MNLIFFIIVLVSFMVAGVRQILWDPGSMEEVPPMELMGASMIGAAAEAVTLAIGLIGVMALFLGLMKIAEEGGLLVIIAKFMRPLMIRLFPDVPPNHPAMGAMILNLSANALGLGNAATPFGIRAMQELDRLNRNKGVATNAMVLFLAINTSSVTLLPTGVIALRSAAGSMDPAGIVPTTLFATICSTTVAIFMAKLLQRFFPQPLPGIGLETSPEKAAHLAESEESMMAPRGSQGMDVDSAMTAGPSQEGDSVSEEPLPQATHSASSGTATVYDDSSYPSWVSFLVLGLLALFVPLTIYFGREISPWIIPSLMVLLMGFGMMKGVRVYESFVEGAKEGFQVALKIIPYLVAILTAIAMLRASGALEAIIVPLGAITEQFGLPAEALPMALLRPLSGSGAYGILASLIQDPTIGPDSYTGYLVSTFQGSTETTFYVLAVYFGAIQIKKVRHALPTAIMADIAGVLAAVLICSILYGYL